MTIKINIGFIQINRFYYKLLLLMQLMLKKYMILHNFSLINTHLYFLLDRRKILYFDSLIYIFQALSQNISKIGRY